MTIKLFLIFLLSAFGFICLPYHSFSQSQIPMRNSETMSNANQLSYFNGVNERNRHSNDGQYESLISIHDSAYFWTWDTLSSSWSSLPYARDINITYDLSYHLTGYLHQAWNGNTWTNDFKLEYTYDASGNKTNFLKLTWDGNAWQNYLQYIYTYDFHRNQLTSLMQNWNGMWVDNRKSDYSYDLNDNMVSILDSNWNGTAWDISSHTSLVYDANDNMISQMFQVSFFGAPLENYSLDTYTYDINNKCISSFRQLWDVNSWVNSNKSTYTYDINMDMTYQLDEYWNSNTWNTGARSYYTYNANHSRTNMLNQQWNGNSWQNVLRFGNTYGADNFNQSYANQHWNQDGTNIEWGDSIYIFYHTVIGIDEPTLGENALLITYPNPASTAFTIQTESSFPLQIEIYNLPGEKMYSAFFDHEPLNVSCELLPAGIYFVKLISSKKTFVGKIIIQ